MAEELGQPSNEETQQSNPAAPAPMAKKSLFDNIDFSKPPPGLMSLAPPAAEAKDDIQSQSQEQDQVQEEPIPVKPSKDLFKEIFADTSESESEDEEEVGIKEPEPQRVEKDKDRDREVFRKQEPVPEQQDEEDAYGPRLPSQLPQSTTSSRSAKYEVAAQTTVKEESLWVEKDAVSRNVKAHKSKKSKSRHKERKRSHSRHKDKSSSKSRKKKKKRKSSARPSDDESDSDNSSDEDADGVEDAYLQSSERTKQLLRTLKTLVNEKDK